MVGRGPKGCEAKHQGIATTSHIIKQIADIYDSLVDFLCLCVRISDVCLLSLCTVAKVTFSRTNRKRSGKRQKDLCVRLKFCSVGERRAEIHHHPSCVRCLMAQRPTTATTTTLLRRSSIRSGHAFFLESNCVPRRHVFRSCSTSGGLCSSSSQSSPRIASGRNDNSPATMDVIVRCRRKDGGRESCHQGCS
jgi:hypothetical protein